MKKLFLLITLLLTTTACQPQSVVDGNQNTNATTTAEITSSINQNQNINTSTTLPTYQVSRLDTSDWLTYTDIVHGFAFKYPPTWKIDRNAYATNLGLQDNADVDGVIFTFENSGVNYQVVVESVNRNFVWKAAPTGFCALAYDSQKQFADEGGKRVNDFTVLDYRRVLGAGDLEFSGQAYTEFPDSKYRLCVSLTINDYIESYATKKGENFYDVYYKEFEKKDYFKKQEVESDLKDVLEEYENLVNSIQVYP